MTMSRDRDEEAYVEHLRNIQLRLEETTSLLISERERNRRMYAESLGKMGQEKEKLKMRER